MIWIDNFRRLIQQKISVKLTKWNLVNSTMKILLIQLILFVKSTIKVCQFKSHNWFKKKKFFSTSLGLWNAEILGYVFWSLNDYLLLFISTNFYLLRISIIFGFYYYYYFIFVLIVHCFYRCFFVDAFYRDIKGAGRGALIRIHRKKLRSYIKQRSKNFIPCEKNFDKNPGLLIFLLFISKQ